MRVFIFIFLFIAIKIFVLGVKDWTTFSGFLFEAKAVFGLLTFFVLDLFLVLGLDFFGVVPIELRLSLLGFFPLLLFFFIVLFNSCP